MSRSNTVSQAQAAKCISYLREVVSAADNKKEAAAELLGCSERTAARMLSRKNPYSSRMRRSWAVRICLAAGVPPDKVIGNDATTYGRLLVGWKHLPLAEAVSAASDLCSTLFRQAIQGYDMRGGYFVETVGDTVKHAVLRLRVCNAPRSAENTLLICYRPLADSGLWVRHFRPGVESMQSEVKLTRENIEKIFRIVFRQQSKKLKCH